MCSFTFFFENTYRALSLEISYVYKGFVLFRVKRWALIIQSSHPTIYDTLQVNIGFFQKNPLTPCRGYQWKILGD